MTTRVDLPEDLLDEIQLRASQQGKKLDETVTDLLRKGLAAPLSMVPANQTTIDARRRVVEKFISGEWGTELSGFESARNADRECAIRRDDKWRA